MGNQASQRHRRPSGCGHEMCQDGELKSSCRWMSGSTQSINSAIYNTFPGGLKKRPPGALKKILRISPYKRYPTIIRIPGLAPEQEPDIVSLGLPFHVVQQIFFQLDLNDLAQCMMVCKEWRSFIDTCDFWRLFLQHTYDLNLKTPPSWSVLREWRHRTSCLKLPVKPSVKADADIPDPYVFRPFPEMWRCGMVVPYGLDPPDGNLDKLHGFIRAMTWLGHFRRKIQELDLGRTLNIQPCLMPWTLTRMPTPREVLDGFNAHIQIIRSATDARTLTPQELRSYYKLLCSRYKGPKFSDKLYYWFTSNCKQANLAFDCDPDWVKPTPSFILTRLDPGWVGGAMYSV